VVFGKHPFLSPSSSSFEAPQISLHANCGSMFQFSNWTFLASYIYIYIYIPSFPSSFSLHIYIYIFVISIICLIFVTNCCCLKIKNNWYKIEWDTILYNWYKKIKLFRGGCRIKIWKRDMTLQVYLLSYLIHALKSNINCSIRGIVLLLCICPVYNFSLLYFFRWSPAELCSSFSIQFILNQNK